MSNAQLPRGSRRFLFAQCRPSVNFRCECSQRLEDATHYSRQLHKQHHRRAGAVSTCRNYLSQLPPCRVIYVASFTLPINQGSLGTATLDFVNTNHTSTPKPFRLDATTTCRNYCRVIFRRAIHTPHQPGQVYLALLILGTASPLGRPPTESPQQRSTPTITNHIAAAHLRQFKMAAQIPEFKIVLLGDGGVGKQDYIEYFNKKSGNAPEFAKKNVSSLGVTVYPLKFHTNRGPVIFNVWNGAGQEVSEIEE